MLEGTLLAESLRVGATVDDLPMRVRRISRYRVQDASADQPEIWTALEFEAEESAAADLAQALADALNQQGWYANFQSPSESWVVFPGRIFRYPRGSAEGRAEAQAYGRLLAIPEGQLDWTV